MQIKYVKGEFMGMSYDSISKKEAISKDTSYSPIAKYSMHTAKDKNEIALIIKSCDDAFEEPITKRAIYEDLLKKFETYGHVLYAYNGNILGYIAFYANQLEYAYISLIAVNPKYQNMHVGKQLLKECERIAVSKQIKNLQLEVKKDNQNAIHFYQSNGFIWIKDKDEKSCYMQKQLKR